MNRWFIPILVALFLTPTFNISITHAQNSSQFSLPVNAKTRLGKGRLMGLNYSDDGTRLAVVSTVGIWL